MGKAPELRPILEERARQRQAEGVRSSLASVIFGEDAPAFRSTSIFDDLAALQAFRERIAGDTSMAARIAPLVRSIVRPELFEIIVPATPGAFTAHYVQRVENRALVGKAPALRALLEERAKALNADGQPIVLSMAVAGAGPTFVTTLPLESLSALEKLRARNQSDPAFQAFVEKLSGLSAGGSSSLMEVIVPFPPQ